MFSVFHGDVLIGRSALESGDPPMGVAYGRFEPTEAYEALRGMMEPTKDGAGNQEPDTRFLSGLRAITSDGILLVCSDVSVLEYGNVDEPFALEVHCVGVTEPPYDELFAHHRKAYDDYWNE